MGVPRAQTQRSPAPPGSRPLTVRPRPEKHVGLSAEEHKRRENLAAQARAILNQAEAAAVALRAAAQGGAAIDPKMLADVEATVLQARGTLERLQVIRRAPAASHQSDVVRKAAQAPAQPRPALAPTRPTAGAQQQGGGAASGSDGGAARSAVVAQPHHRERVQQGSPPPVGAVSGSGGPARKVWYNGKLVDSQQLMAMKQDGAAGGSSSSTSG